MNRVGVIGAGSWGTALALLLAQKGFEVVLWARREAHAVEIAEARENRAYLPGFRLPEALRITIDLVKVVREAEALLFVVPSHGLRGVAAQVSEIISRRTKATGWLSEPQAIISATKGIENDTLLTMTEVLQEVLPASLGGRMAAVSGPSFAREVAGGVPTAVTVAARDQRVATAVQALLATEAFRVYTSLDVIGVQLGGALKNVMAIAAGISDGLGFGTNTRAALITRGLAEMARLGVRLGANPLTFAGLAGLGDLVLTCTGDLSRNRSVGLRLGQGQSLEEILQEMQMVAEGVKTAQAAWSLARKWQVEMPITHQVYRVLYEGCKPEDAVRELLLRPPRPEGDLI